MKRRIALDTNLLVLWIVGQVAPGEIGRHRRVRAFTPEDFYLLISLLDQREIVITPNTMTEASNLTRQGFSFPHSENIANLIASLASAHEEIYLHSATAVAAKEFKWLGIADVVLLEIASQETAILTVDAKLYDAALKRMLPATNFNSEREQAGTV